MRTANPEAPTKQKIMGAATDLMISKGYVATTVDEICQAAEVTKGSFFHYFKTKDDLGREILIEFSQAMGRKIQAAVEKVGDDPLERIYGYLDFFSCCAQDSDMKGCLVGTMTQEIANTHPELKAVCCESLQKGADMFKADIVKAKEKYAPDADFDAESLGSYFQAVMQGSMLIMKASPDRSIFTKNIEHLKEYIRCLFGK